MVEASSSDENLQDRWISRNRDAHAWVEAYDRDLQKWVIVESTPDVEVDRDPWSTAADSLVGPSESLEGQQSQQQRIGLLDEIRNWFQGRGSKLVDQIFTVINWIARLAAIVVAIWLIRRWWLGRRTSQYRLKAAGRQLAKFDRRLARRGIRRKSSETLHQFSDRIKEQGAQPDAWVLEAAEAYRDYASQRYTLAR